MKSKGLSLKYKQGNMILNTVLVIAFMFVFSILAFYAYTVLNDFNTDLQNDISISNESKNLMQEQTSRFPTLFDGLFMTFFVFIWGFLLVAAFMSDSHPIFFIFMIILMVIVLILAIMFGNSYEEFSSDDQLSSVIANFPMMNWIMTHALMVVIGIIFSVMIVLFTKRWSE